MKLTIVSVFIVSLTVIALQVNHAETSPIQPNNKQVEIKFEYHDYEKMTHFLNTTASAYKDIVHLYSIGESVKGKKLWVMAISSKPNEHVIGRPEVKFVGNIHGDEAVGREILLHFIHMLVTGYTNDNKIRELLDTTRIHIFPNMNPDGSELSENSVLPGRGNANGVDLDENFPGSDPTWKPNIQPETEAVMKWSLDHHFVLSGSLHTGAVVAVYPGDKKTKDEGASPDEDDFRHLAVMYAKNHKSMNLGKRCFSNVHEFEDGVTNGLNYRPIKGSMQDYNYFHAGCMEISLGISCYEHPSIEKLSSFWEENREALLAFTYQAHRGIKGVVYGENKKPIAGASVKIEGRSVSFNTTKYGEYWRMLSPKDYKTSSSYEIQVEADGYIPYVSMFTVVENGSKLIKDIQLVALPPYGSSSTNRNQNKNSNSNSNRNSNRSM